MTITKKEFIELYKEYEAAWQLWDKYEEVLSEAVREHFLEPYEFIFHKIDNELYDIMINYHFYKHYPIKWKTDKEGNCYDIEYSNNLEEIYDRYLGNKKEN